MTTFTVAQDFVIEDCIYQGCYVTFALNREHYNRLQAKTGTPFYCPNGHQMHYTGKSAEQKLKDAEARETALRDQLDASIREAEAARSALMRDRQRFIKGVCPCCNRYFPNVHRHMVSQHPDYDIASIKRDIKFKCGCGRSFDTYHGLRVHQSKQRGPNWAKPGQSAWSSHLTVGATR